MEGKNKDICGYIYPVTTLKIHDWKHTFDDFSKRENPDIEAMFDAFCQKLKKNEQYRAEEILLYRFCIRYISECLEKESDVKNIPEELLSVMEIYGSILPALEIRIPEWICDYLFIKSGNEKKLQEINEFFKGKTLHSLFSADFQTFDFIKSILNNENGESCEISKNGMLAVLKKLCNYDFSSSALYRENQQLYEELLCLVVPKVICHFLKENSVEFIFSENRRIIRPAYSGLLCTCGTLKMIEIEYVPISENKSLREFVTSTVKYCDNLIRQGLSVKSKLAGITLSSETKKLIADTVRKERPGFLGVPARQGRKPAPEKFKKAKKKEESERKICEPFVLDVDFTKAKELEKESWSLMNLVGNDYGGEEIEYSPLKDNSEKELCKKQEIENIQLQISSDSELLRDDDFSIFIESLTHTEREILKCIICGGDVNAVAKAYGGMAEGFAERINERALELIGDIIIEKDEKGCLSIFDEYKDELENLI